MYCWTLLSRDIGDTPRLMGVTDSLARAQRLAEPHLVSGAAFLGYIELVRPAISVHGLGSCYVRVGRDWLGRLTTSDLVRWTEQEGRATEPSLVTA
jgi:hypothetical protein